MPQKQRKPEENVAKLWQVDAVVAGRPVAEAIRPIGLTALTRYRGPRCRSVSCHREVRRFGAAGMLGLGATQFDGTQVSVGLLRRYGADRRYRRARYLVWPLWLPRTRPA